MKFTRREDLDAKKRITIAMLAFACQGEYGARTALAQQYQISRTFLYQLLNVALFCLTELFSVEDLESIPINRLDADRIMVLLRLEGKVSISGIGEIMDQQGYPYHSNGLVSQRLTVLGGNLPNTLSVKEEREVFTLADELHALNIPILITIEAKSTAILKIELAKNRQADTWDKHFRAIEAANYKISGLCSDRGTGLMGGFQMACPNQTWLSDHFHEFNELRKLCVTLESQAYAAIAYEDERKRILNNARSETNSETCRLKLEWASNDCAVKIYRYQQVADTLALLFPSLYFFDLQSGKLRRPTQVKETLLTLMDWLDELDYPALQVETRSIRNHIDDICHCYKRAEEIYQSLSATISEDILNFIGLAWQYDHQSHQHKGKQKQYLTSKSQFWHEVAASLLEEKTAEIVIAQAFDALDDMNRTSSLIEMVNSLIRPFLNSCKGQITQEQLNLIMFYHNHRRYKTGKRQGKAPIEILNGVTLQKHWLDLLFNTVEQKRRS